MAQITGVMNTTAMLLRLGGATINLLTDASCTFTHEPRRTTSKDSQGYNTYLEGIRDWTVSGTAWYADDATVGTDEILALAITTRATGTVLLGTGVIGNQHYTGSAWLTQWEISSPNAEENVTYSFTLQGTGALTKATT